MKSGSSYSSDLRRLKVTCSFLVMGLVFLFSACSPEVVQRLYNEPNRDFGPQKTDDNVDLGEMTANAIPSASTFNFSGRLATASWYRSMDDLSLLSRLTGDEALGRLSFAMASSVYNGAVSWRHTVARSAYTSAAIGETKEDTAVAVQSGVNMLTSQEPLIQGILDRQHQLIAWPNTPTNLEAILDLVERYLAGVASEMEVSAVEPAVKERILQEVRITFGPMLARFKIQAHLAYQEPKTYDFVARLRQAVEAEKIEIGKEPLERLKTAEKLTRDVEQIRSSRAALRVIVDFWKASSPEVRETKFKPVSPELYDYLYGKTESELNCIRSNCGFLTRIAKALFILPAIEDYGVKKLRKELEIAAHDAIYLELETTATQYAAQLNTLVAEQVFVELRRQSDNLKKISSDYGSYIRLVMDRMAIAKLGLTETDSVGSIEPSEVEVQMNFGRGERDHLAEAPVGIVTKRVAAIENNSSARRTRNTRNRTRNQELTEFVSGAEAIGAGLSAAIDQHDHNLERELTAQGVNPIVVQQVRQRVFFEQINKVLMIGGFKTEALVPFEALSLSIDRDRPRYRRLNLRDLMGSPLSYAVPDRLSLTEPKRPEMVLGSVPRTPVRVSVAGQAEMLRGLSRLAASLKDWESTSFDTGLGRVNLADFVPDLPRDAVDRSLFPKDLMFAATIGNASVILQNITKRLSSVVLIDPNRKMHWANEQGALESNPENRATMAAIFDLVDGERSEITRAGDVARFISAIAEFVRATNGIENTKAGPLLEKGDDGKRPLDLLVSARTDLKLLIMAMSNFLARETIGADGLVRPFYDRSDLNAGPVSKGDPLLLDQALVIRALLDAAETISADVYRTSAIELMASVNQHFYRPALAFYSAIATGTVRADFETTLAMLVAGERMSKGADSERRARWNKVARPWVGALRDAAMMVH